MSGLIGKLSYDHEEPLARPALEQMLDALRHRGAGARGIFMARGIALGCWSDDHRPAWGPVVASNEDETVRVAADAFLTNALDLRKRLEEAGHVFDGRTCGELIAHAYDEWGDAAVEHLEGPFACAIWDLRRRRLLLARDHLGVRPLYFALLPGHGIVFASETRALLHDPGVGRDWCPAAIDAYLALGYVPAPLTPYKRISKLEPAQRLTLEGRRFHLESFWDLPSPTAEAGTPASELHDRVQAATAAHLYDDCVSATLVSGGAASAALAVCAAEAVPAAIIVALDQDGADLARADALVRHIGGAPTIEVASVDIAAASRQLAAHLDEPVADPAAVAQYTVYRAARLHADAALAGHGAAVLWESHAVDRARAGHDVCREIWPERERRAVYTRGFAWAVKDLDALARHRELYASRDSADPLDRLRYVEVRTSLSDSTLAIADRAAFAAGLRLHLPFMDRLVVELAARVPAAALAQGGATDDALHALLSRRLPPALVPRRRRTQDSAWLRGALAALVPRTLLAHRFDGRGILSRPALQQLWDEHAGARRDHTYRLWSLLMLEFWFREFIDGDAAEEPAEYALLKVA